MQAKSAAPSPPLVVAPSDFRTVETPFAGDLLNRRKTAEQLTRYLERLQVGAVIALDAPWGEGKSWFGHHWAASLRQQNYCVGMLDAFHQDYVEDAFLPLAAAILELCVQDTTTTQAVKTRAVAVMRALLPISTKALINLAGRAAGLTGIADELSDAVKEVAADAVKDGAGGLGDAASAWVEHRLEVWGHERETVEHFRQTLSAFAKTTYEQTGKPVVILIDELDRCRPAFAVRLIERIKHFFDVPHLGFVLLMNRDQLEKAIRGVYGSDTDARAYLGKFLHLSLRLPKERSRDPNKENHAQRAFITQKMEQHGMPHQDFPSAFAACAATFDLSLRDIERGCALYALANNGNVFLTAYLIALKLKHPDVYDGLATVGKQSEAHKACIIKLNPEIDALVRAIGRPDLGVQALGFPGNYFHALTLLHSAKQVGQVSREHWDSGRDAIGFVLNGLTPDGAFEYIMRTLDLDVQ